MWNFFMYVQGSKYRSNSKEYKCTPFLFTDPEGIERTTSKGDKWSGVKTGKR